MRRFFALLLCLGGCAPPRSNPSPAASSTTALSPADAGPACAAFCAHARALSCPEARPTADGQPCEIWCQAFAVTPAGIDPLCGTQAASCADMQRCRR